MKSENRWIIEIKNRAFSYVLLPYADLGVTQWLAPNQIGLTNDLYNATFFTKKNVAEMYLHEIIRVTPELTKKDITLRSVKVIVELTDEK